MSHAVWSPSNDPTAARPMTGLFAALTEDQKKAAIDYRGEDGIGASGAQKTMAGRTGRSWWPLAVLALAIGAFAGWLVLWFVPHDLASLGRQMFAVCCIVVSVAPVLFVKGPSEGVRP